MTGAPEEDSEQVIRSDEIECEHGTRWQSASTHLNECQNWQWVLFTGHHDDSIAGGDGGRKDCYHGEERFFLR